MTYTMSHGDYHEARSHLRCPLGGEVHPRSVGYNEKMKKKKRKGKDREKERKGKERKIKDQI